MLASIAMWTDMAVEAIMVTTEEWKKQHNELQKLYDRVFSGERVICPICGDGYLQAVGNTHICCERKDCRMKVDFYVARPRE